MVEADFFSLWCCYSGFTREQLFEFSFGEGYILWWKLLSCRRWLLVYLTFLSKTIHYVHFYITSYLYRMKWNFFSYRVLWSRLRVFKTNRLKHEYGEIKSVQIESSWCLSKAFWLYRTPAQRHRCWPGGSFYPRIKRPRIYRKIQKQWRKMPIGSFGALLLPNDAINTSIILWSGQNYGDLCSGLDLGAKSSSAGTGTCSLIPMP